MTQEIITFSADIDTANSSINGKSVKLPCPVLFRAGNYPEKKWDITPEELSVAAAEFSGPMNLDIEHKPSVFDGKIGTLDEVKLNKSEKEKVGGSVTIPIWLHNLLPKTKRGLSLAFNRNTKKIVGCAITTNPRISNAAMLASFNNFNEGMDGTGVATPASVTDPSEGSGTLHGKDLCEKLTEILKKSFDDAEKSDVFDGKYKTKLKKLMELCESIGGKKKSSSDSDDDDDDDDDANYNSNNRKPDSSIVKFYQDKVEQDAHKFAYSLVEAFKATPGEYEGIVAAYQTVANGDITSFSSTGKMGSGIDTFKKMCQDRPENKLTKEGLKDTALFNVGNNTGGDSEDLVEFSLDSGEKVKISRERYEELMGCSHMGQTTLEDKKKAAANAS